MRSIRAGEYVNTFLTDSVSALTTSTLGSRSEIIAKWKCSLLLCENNSMTRCLRWAARLVFWQYIEAIYCSDTFVQQSARATDPLWVISYDYISGSIRLKSMQVRSYNSVNAECFLLLYFYNGGKILVYNIVFSILIIVRSQKWGHLY